MINKEPIIPRITFGMIVLNGEPFISYNLSTLYPFAHQIIVVEGACPTAKRHASVDGHSLDRTLDVLREFKLSEDFEDKLIIVTAEDENHINGFWTEKDEMSQAYAKRANGNFLWQVDIDEFYHEDDIKTVMDILKNNPGISGLSFRTITFWGGFNYRTDGIYLRKGAQDFHRLFSWHPNYKYLTHRPPTVVDEQGTNLRTLKWISADSLTRKNILLYHYSFVFPFQVLSKYEYHDGLNERDNLSDSIRKKRKKWLRNYFDLKMPFLIDDTSVISGPSWLRRFQGKHPNAIMNLMDDISNGKIKINIRSTEDIEKLISNPFYYIMTKLIPLLYKPSNLFINVRMFLYRFYNNYLRTK